MRVLITMPWGRRLGGAESMMWSLLRNIDRSRMEPRMVFLESGPFVEEVARLRIDVTVIRARRLRNVGSTAAAVRRLSRRIAAEQPEIVLNWSPKTQLYGASAAALSRSRAPVVWWQHGVPDAHWIDRLATALPAAAIGCSSVASTTAQRRLRPRRRTFVVRPGVELPARPGPGDRRRLRRELGLPAEPTIIGIVGRLQPWKGQDRFLRAVAALRADGLDVHGLVVGGDAYALSPHYPADLRRLIGALGIEPHVTMTGQLADPRGHIAAMDVLVNASRGEPFGVVLLEAMALGVPVVGVASAGPAEIIEHGRSGLLAPDVHPHSIAHVLRRLVADPGLRARLGERGRRRVEACFTAERMAAELQERLEEVVSGP